MKHAYKILVGKTDGKRLLGRSRKICKDFREKEVYWIVDLIHMVLDKGQW
jgi:hypothetical protein